MMDFLPTFVLLISFAVVRGCGDPPVISDSDNDLTGTAPYAEGTSVTYTCSVGYKAQGYSNVYTCTDGSWQGGPYTCEEIRCPYFFEKPKNGFIVGSPTYKINSFLMFDCNEGYDVVGYATLRCKIDGWTPTSSLPSCEPKNCGEFGQIQNGAVFQPSPDGVKNDYGSEVIVSCNDGFTASGPAKVYCMADGTWGTRPECVASQCPDYPGLNYTKCLLKSLVRADVIYMYCDADVNKVTKVGSGSSALCMDSQWTDTSLACYCNCECKSNDADLKFDNCNANGYILHENPLSWSCKAGSHKKSGADVKCFDGDFSTEPECEPGATDPPPATTSSPINIPPNCTIPGAVEVKISVMLDNETLVLDWECSSFHRKSTDERVTCTNGQLSHIPFCELILELLILVILLITIVVVIFITSIWCCFNFFHSIWLKLHQAEIKENLSCTSKMGMCLAGGVCKSYSHDRYEIGVECHVYCFNCCCGGNEEKVDHGDPTNKDAHDPCKQPLRVDHGDVEPHNPCNQPLRVDHGDVEMAPINA